jgi:hypothetical protein
VTVTLVDCLRLLDRRTKVTGGESPHARIIATHSTNGVVDRTRPLCAYPEVARYAGSGSTDDAANFVYRRP